MNDPVNNPKHYKLFPDMEAIDVIERTLTPEEFAGYLKGNALKYRLRAGEKGDTQQDIDKSNWYRRRLSHGHIDQVITDLLRNKNLTSAAAFEGGFDFDRRAETDNKPSYRDELKTIFNDAFRSTEIPGWDDTTTEEDEAFQALHIGTEWCDHSAGRHSYSSTKEAQCI